MHFETHGRSEEDASRSKRRRPFQDHGQRQHGERRQHAAVQLHSLWFLQMHTLQVGTRGAGDSVRPPFFFHSKGGPKCASNAARFFT